MRPLDVAASYDRIAGIWASPTFDRRDGMAQHERALAFTTQRGAALDVGCGSSGRFIEWLVSRGFAAEGLDLSAEMLRLARQAHPRVVFHQADICEWTPPKTYDFITAWDSLWHVPLDQQHAVLLKLCKALSPDGVFIFTAGGLQAPDEHLDDQMGVPMYYASLGVPRVCSVLTEGGCSLRHLEYDQHPQSHVYVIAQRIVTGAHGQG